MYSVIPSDHVMHTWWTSMLYTLYTLWKFTVVINCDYRFSSRRCTQTARSGPV